jgi:small-conductance mechanosensitive channel
LPAAEAARLVLAKLAHGLYGALVFVAVTGVGIVFAMLVRRMVRRTLGLSQLPRGLVDLASKSVYYFIVSLAAIVGLALAGVDVTGFAFAGSLLGVALGFAAQTVASNFFSGFFLYIDKPLQPGEFVELEGSGIVGRVLDVTMFSTRIETLDGRIVRIPNEDVFKSTIVNLHRSVARRVEYLVGISYSAPLEEARRAIMEVLDSHPLVLAEPPPEIYVEELGDSAVVLRVMFWVPSWRWLELKRHLLGEIKKALDDAGVEIPFPQRVVWLRLPEGGEDAAKGSLEEALRGALGAAGDGAEALG